MTLSQDDESIKIVTTDVPGAPKPANLGPHKVPVPMPQQYRYFEVDTPQGKRLMRYCQQGPQVRHNLLSNQQIQIGQIVQLVKIAAGPNMKK